LHRCWRYSFLTVNSGFCCGCDYGSPDTPNFNILSSRYRRRKSRALYRYWGYDFVAVNSDCCSKSFDLPYFINLVRGCRRRYSRGLRFRHCNGHGNRGWNLSIVLEMYPYSRRTNALCSMAHHLYSLMLQGFFFSFFCWIMILRRSILQLLSAREILGPITWTLSTELVLWCHQFLKGEVISYKRRGNIDRLIEALLSCCPVLFHLQTWHKPQSTRRQVDKRTRAPACSELYGVGSEDFSSKGRWGWLGVSTQAANWGWLGGVRDSGVWRGQLPSRELSRFSNVKSIRTYDGNHFFYSRTPCLGKL